jgi:ribonuclease G
METRVALVDNGVLQEIYIERSRARGIVGNIYKGKVIRVLPGMQAAFVDMGLERSAFIHAADIASRDDSGMEEAFAPEQNIRNALNEGSPVVVQVIKEPIGTKGARLTTHLTVSSRFLVYMPHSQHVGVSQRIEDDVERERLKQLVESALIQESMRGGIILRTAAEGVGEDEILADMRFLKRLWASVAETITVSNPPQLIHEDLPLYMRIMRDLVRPGLERIRIDSHDGFTKVNKFVAKLIPELVGHIELYSGERPLFDMYGVEGEIQRALGRKVELKSGGYLIIDQTEAMTTIDVNTGGFVGHRNLEETIYKTNLEAAKAAARQLRVRNLGGIIIIDFIDMKDPEHQRQVLRTLEKAMERDYAKVNMTGISDLGLVQMTRKRTRESLTQMLCEPCNVCKGRGYLKSPETVCYEICREILREARAYESAKRLMVLASQSVVDRLLDEDSASIADLETFIGKTIEFQVEALYTQEQFDVILL